MTSTARRNGGTASRMAAHKKGYPVTKGKPRSKVRGYGTKRVGKADRTYS